MFQVNFVPENILVQVEAGENLLDAARRGNIFLDLTCNGNRTCGKCLLKIIKGSVDTAKTHLLSQEECDQGYVLACNSRIKEDLTIESPRLGKTDLHTMKIESMTEEKDEAILKKAIQIAVRNNMKFNSGVKKDYLELDLPSLDDNVSDWDRIRRYFDKELGYPDLNCRLSILQKIPKVLREGNFKVTLTYRTDNPKHTEIINVESGNTCARLYGVAIDVGTTSIAALLVNLLDGRIIGSASAGNEQIKFGADVINRIVHSTRKNGLEELQKALVEDTLNPVLNKMYKEAQVEKNEIASMVVAGNTTMTHLFLGVYPDYLRKEPYIPCFTDLPVFKVSDLGLDGNLDAPVYILPSVANYVGGDITGGVLASGLWDTEENTLLIDLGTNGEIVFGNKDFLLTCACSAGPAFEGGGLSCGMRAAVGAIEKVSIDRNTLQPIICTIQDSKPLGICGSGIIDAVAEMFLTGVIDSRGRINKNMKSSRIRFDEYDIGEYVLASKEEWQIQKDITITEIDLENIIRAKGAVYSAVAVLLSSLGYDFSIDKIIIAGGIGNNIDISNAITIGLFPDIPVSQYEFIGNSSLTGCYLALTSHDCAYKIYEISMQMTYIELSTNPDYMNEFVSACFLPHTNMERFPAVKARMENTTSRKRAVNE